MATQRLGTPDARERVSDLQRKRLAAEWVAIDKEVRATRKRATDRARRQTEIAGILADQLRLDKVALIDLPRHQFGFELKDGSLSYKGELLKAIGEDALQALADAVPQVEKVFVREKVKPAKSAAKAKPGKQSRRRAA